jgi:hypothetical protein
MYIRSKKKKGLYSFRLITKSNDNILLLPIIMFKLFIILVFILFYNREVTQLRCIGILSHGSTYSIMNYVSVN